MAHCILKMCHRWTILCTVAVYHLCAGEVDVYRGLPYATVPQRFSPPQPLPKVPWRGLRGVKSDRGFKPACPQRQPDGEVSKGRQELLRRALSHQSEDCLYLNIYSPSGPSSTKYPVLLFIQGERFEWSYGHLYDGSELASYGRLVVVTISYRLGILGFLNTNPGRRTVANFGLLDQIAALQWIQDNIHMFGGDAGSVTVLGHGSGAACVHWLMTSPAVSPGKLFHRAVLMSGSALSVGSLVKEPLKAAQDVARHLNCTEDHRLLSCLREKPLKMLLSAPVPTSQILPTFGPSEDGVIIVADQLQFSHWSRHDHKHPRRGLAKISLLQGVDNLTLRHGKKANYDLLLGVVNAEAFSYFSEEDILYGIEAWKKIQVLQSFINGTYRHHQTQILATLVNEYTEWERPVQHPINTLYETVEALGDGLVVAPILHTADMHSGNCFLYVFSHQIRSGLYPQKQGCVHGEELPYVFGVPLMNASSQTHATYNFSNADARLSKSIMTYWANFARTGNPNRSGDHSPHHLQKTQKPLAERWLPYDKIHKRYLLFDSKPRLRNHYRAHRLSFWLNLVPQLLTDVADDQFAADSS